MQIENRIVTCNEKAIRLNLFVMNKSCYIWIGPDGDDSPSFGSLVTAIQTRYEPMPTSKTLLSAEGEGQDESIETGISQRLCRKFKIQTFISYNLPPSFETERVLLEGHLVRICSTFFGQDAIAL